jgi:hypothetical protein
MVTPADVLAWSTGQRVPRRLLRDKMHPLRPLVKVVRLRIAGLIGYLPNWGYTSYFRMPVNQE